MNRTIQWATVFSLIVVYNNFFVCCSSIYTLCIKNNNYSTIFRQIFLTNIFKSLLGSSNTSPLHTRLTEFPSFTFLFCLLYGTVWWNKYKHSCLHSLLLFVYFVYTYSCSVVCEFSMCFMLLFVVILSSIIICKLVCFLHCFFFVKLLFIILISSDVKAKP